MGAITIGDNARIGAASVVTHSVPANATAVGIPARVSVGNTQDEITKLNKNNMNQIQLKSFKGKKNFKKESTNWKKNKIPIYSSRLIVYSLRN